MNSQKKYIYIPVSSWNGSEVAVFCVAFQTEKE
jgi:hypothetical protein